MLTKNLTPLTEVGKTIESTFATPLAQIDLLKSVNKAIREHSKEEVKTTLEQLKINLITLRNQALHSRNEHRLSDYLFQFFDGKEEGLNEAIKFIEELLKP